MFFQKRFKQVFRRIMFGLIAFSMICTAVGCVNTSTTAVSSASENITYWDVNANTMHGSQVGGLSGVVAIASSTRLDVDFGLDYGVALKTDGTVWSWDEMVAGSQIDNAEAVQISGLNNISSISTGFGNSLALDSGGNVWSWGNNDFGQFGIGITGGGDQPQGTTTVPGTTPPSLIPQPVQVTGLNNVKAVSSGLQHCLALKTDGTVWAWGDNEWGQLGDGTTTNRYLPTRVKNLEGIIAISAGDYHSLALKSDGTVWAWGDNESGELGDGTTANSYVPVQVKGLNHIIAIAAGEAQSLALKSDGTVWSWGNNENGQAGNGTQNSTVNPGVLTPVQVPNMKDVVDIAEGRMPGGGPYWDGGTVKYGEGYCMVLKSDGTVWDWREVGYPTETSFKTKPVQVTGLSGVKAIAAGDNYAIAIVANPSIQAATTGTAIGSILNPQPVDVLSVQGPLPPINPGGPNVEITLKNVSTEPVVSLTAVFTNLGARDIDINFEVGPVNPLLPGATISDTQTLIDGGFSNNVLYPLTIEGTLQSGTIFSYVEEIEIVEPPN